MPVNKCGVFGVELCVATPPHGFAEQSGLSRLAVRQLGAGLPDGSGKVGLVDDNAIATPGVEEPSVESFADFYRREYKPVLGIVFGLSGSRTASEELTQDAFSKAHGAWSKLRLHANRDAWIRRVAINGALSWRRRRIVEARALTRLSRERPALAELPPQPDELWSAVRALPRNQAIAVTLRYHDDRSIAEIADVIGCAEATVRVHLHRGRQALAAALNLEDPETDQI